MKTIVTDSHLYSFLKSITWRILATLTTVIISYIVTRQWRFALSIGFAEMIAKIALYYFHERLWQRSAMRPQTTEAN